MSRVFDHPDWSGHEQVVYACDAASGLKAIIAVHDTTLGPALGGCRMWSYADEAAALTDVLRLSRAMTSKAAVAGLALGGGKSVVIGNAARDKSPALLRAMGKAVDRLGRRYIVAEDVGIGPNDLAVMAGSTRHVAGLEKAAGGSGDPSPETAYGVFVGIKAAVAHRLGRDGVRGLTVAVQGLGHVGFALARFLVEAGAQVVATDIDAARLARAVETLGVIAIEGGSILEAEADVFAPCALGGAIDESAPHRLKAKVVAGSANNQLSRPGLGTALAAAGILYAPDYVINAGGLISVGREIEGYGEDEVRPRIERIGATLTEIFKRAQDENRSTDLVADDIARELLDKARSARMAA